MRVLLVTSRNPLPAWRGNQARTVEWIGALSDHELALACPGTRDSRVSSLPVEPMYFRLGPGSRATGLLRAVADGRPLQEGLYDTASARREVAATLNRWRPDVAIVQMVRCGWAVDTIRNTSSNLPVVFDAIDSMALHFESAARSAAFPMAFAYRAEAARCRRRESSLATAATVTVAVSDRDLAALSAPVGRRRTVPVTAREVAEPASASREPIILLSGNLGYRPTIRGALWFAHQVWPRLHATNPGARWVLAGARPTAALRGLGKMSGVDVHADVPDLGAFLARARVAIAPMSSGSGVPMKVLEAMAAGVPAVVHPWAAEGLVGGAREGVVVASEVDDWAAALERLLGDPGVATAAGRRGHEVWRQFYHPDRVAGQIREVVSEAAR